MKAYVLEAINDFALKEVDRPVPKKGEVLVKVKTTGICGSDIPRIFKNGTYSYPLIPGHEFAGEVEETGDEVSKEWIGKRVGIFPLIPCRKCAQCAKMEYEMCRNYNYLGSRCNGGFAEYVCVPEWNLIELPSEVSYEAAAMLEPMCVAAHAVRKLTIKPQETVTVWGMGTIGLLIVMLLKAMGINNIYAVGNKKFQGDVISRIGLEADSFCNMTETDAGEWITKKTNHIGADVFIECVGKNETIEKALDLTRPGGKVSLVGNPHSDILLKRNLYWKVLRNQLTLQGTWNSSYTGESNDDWHYILKLLRKKEINPELLITHVFEQQTFEQGFAMMRDKTAEYIKVIGKMS